MGASQRNEKSVADLLELENVIKVDVFLRDEKNPKGKQIPIVHCRKGFGWRNV
jgi:hypothetical protein